MSERESDVPPLSDPYGKARTLTTLAAGLLLVSIFTGIEVGDALPFLGIAVPEPEQTRLLLALLTFYGGTRTAIEWFQTDPRRRGRTASRVDLGFTAGIAVLALGVYAYSAFDFRFITWRFAGKVIGAGAWGFATGLVVGHSIWSIPFIRSADRARRLALPRIPVAVRSSFTMAAAWSTITALGLTVWYLASPSSFAAGIGAFLLPLGVVMLSQLIEVLRPTRKLADGSREPTPQFVQRISEVFDLHDNLYRLHGGMSATGDPPSLLFQAASAGDLEQTHALLQSGSNPDEREQFGWTPLMIAAAEQHVPVVEALLRAGANPNLYNTHGRTALMFAARYGNGELVAKLLEGGADPNFSRFGHEPVALAVAAGQGHVAVVRHLLAADADVNALDMDGNTALDLAHRGGHGEVAAMLRNRMRDHAV